jgi:uncharacterized protein YjbJ (UPF0337 family)
MLLERPGVWHQVGINWKRFYADARKAWAKLTDDDLDYIAGNRYKLVERLQLRYNIVEAEAMNQVDFWADDLWI